MPRQGHRRDGGANQCSRAGSFHLNMWRRSVAEEPIGGGRNCAYRCWIRGCSGAVIIVFVIIVFVITIVVATMLQVLTMFVVIVAGQDDRAAAGIRRNIIGGVTEHVGGIWADGCSRREGHDRTDGCRGK